MTSHPNPHLLSNTLAGALAEASKNEKTKKSWPQTWNSLKHYQAPTNDHEPWQWDISGFSIKRITGVSRYVYYIHARHRKYGRLPYPSKAHTSAIHFHVRPHYLHTEQSQRTLLRAVKPSSQRGCVELVGSLYYKGVPLPRIPVIRKLGTSSA